MITNFRFMYIYNSNGIKFNFINPYGYKIPFHLIYILFFYYSLFQPISCLSDERSNSKVDFINSIIYLILNTPAIPIS